jgi:hypothetical protein
MNRPAENGPRVDFEKLASFRVLLHLLQVQPHYMGYLEPRQCLETGHTWAASFADVAFSGDIEI